MKNNTNYVYAICSYHSGGVGRCVLALFGSKDIAESNIKDYAGYSGKRITDLYVVAIKVL